MPTNRYRVDAEILDLIRHKLRLRNCKVKKLQYIKELLKLYLDFQGMLIPV